MATGWLPYLASSAPSSPPRRPSAPSLRPAVVVPLAVFLVLIGAVSVAATTPKPSSQQAQTLPDASLTGSLAALPGIFTPSVQAWGPEIRRWSEMYQIRPDFIAVVMTLESCGDPSVRSSAGAMGLFQVMPFHFRAGEDPFDPETNARRGLAYLHRALELAGGDYGLALAGYNGGHGVIGRAPMTWAAETRRYEAWGTGMMDDLANNRNPSPALQSWLDAGGRSLCQRAEG